MNMRNNVVVSVLLFVGFLGSWYVEAQSLEEIPLDASQVDDTVKPTTPINGFGETIKPQKPKAKAASKSAAPNKVKPYTPVLKLDNDVSLPEITMFVGESRVFPAPGVGRIAVGNGGIMTAAALDNKEVILFANGVGTSSLFIWNQDGRYQRLKVNITPGDTARIAREISNFVAGIQNAKTSIIGDKVIVEGDSLSDVDLARIEMLEKRYPQIVNFTNPQGFEQMVMIDVKVVEFPTNFLRQIGLNWTTTGLGTVGAVWGRQRVNGADNSIAPIAGSGAVTVPITKADGTALSGLPGKFNLLALLNMGLSATLNLTEQNGLSTTLAQPQLSARNGSKATFLAGGEFPYTISTINGPSIFFKPYGISLSITPRVDRSGNIRALVDTEVSQIDSTVSTSAGPGLLTRKTATEFNVKSGDTIILSGLIQRQKETSVDKLPFLGDIPILGALFRSKRFQDKATELVIFVTPTVVSPSSPGMSERISRTSERLTERFGEKPYLENPVMPNAEYGRPDEIPPPPPVKEVPVNPAWGYCLATAEYGNCDYGH